ncbi:class I SAM-dependent DNA methyltransferase [Georgenia alba]|uniref:Class I SAM-dependent DNA methyltransferase n=1 Tax=Georgenia alba TaxID=2233858 RepID=A0ABW2Q507_9MICO
MSYGTTPRPIYQHPLAYLLGLHGVALMRAFAGEHDREFVHDRIAEMRRLLDAPDHLGDGHEVPPLPVTRGYAHWAPRYDGPNGFWGFEEPLVRPLMAKVPPGVAVDAACGTGRHTEWLVERGHEVHAFDLSPDMLAIARQKVPGARFEQADFRRLPMLDASADLVVNTLALCHVEDLGPVFAEAARILRPGGHLVVSDTRSLYVGSPLYPLIEGADGEIGYIPGWSHETSDYLRAALDHGLSPTYCHEPRSRSGGGVEPAEPAEPTEPRGPADASDRPPDVWELMTWAAASANAAYAGRPVLVIWDFERQ